MSERSGVGARARQDALRLLVLALTLAGFVAMHGLASAGSDGSHCAPPVALISSAATAAHDMADSSTAVATGVHVDLASDPTVASVGSTHGDGDELMAGCLLALLGGLVALVLRLLRMSAEHIPSSSVSSALSRARAARAPPPPLFLSLCVFRL
jgi:hypothetical protein